MRKLLAAIMLLLAVSIVPFGNSLISEETSTVYKTGEYLKYEVSFLGVTLGWITIDSEGVEEWNGKTVNKASATMKSRDGIPFVDLYAEFEGWMDPSLSYSHHFASNTKDGSSWVYEQYDINYDKKNIEYRKWRDKQLEEEDVIENNKRVVDGTTLFFIARQYTNMKRSVTIPTLISNKIQKTYINFHGKVEGVDLDAVDYEVKTLFFDGKADWEGIYGLNGKFQGWFSADEARIPIKAKMNVYVGNVDISLVEWKRGGWQPPKM